MSRIATRSAPALNERPLADATITPADSDSDSESMTADSSTKSCGVQIFTDFPGMSRTTVRTLSESVNCRTNRCIFSPLSGVTRSGHRAPSRARVQRPRPNQSVVVVLLDHVGTPAGDARASKDRRVQMPGNAQHLQHGGGVEVDIGVEVLLPLH